MTKQIKTPAQELKAAFARRVRHTTVTLVDNKVVLKVPTQANRLPSANDYAWHEKEAARLGAKVESVARAKGRWVLTVTPAAAE